MKKNGVMVLVTLGCLVVAGVVVATQMGGDGETRQTGDRLFVCDDCGADFNLTKSEWVEISKQANRDLMQPKATCPNCGSTATHGAVLCEHCSTVFSKAKVNENGGKCPSCGQPIY